MERLVLVRHGETAWNARRVLQGQADIELSARGREQAHGLREVVSRWSPQVVVCSDLLRTRQTAAALGRLDASYDARWREADLGDWTGQSSDDLKTHHFDRYSRWRNGLDAPPNGESFEQLRDRVTAAIDALSTESGTVMVVTHGGVIRVALSILIGLQADRIVPVDPASATVFELRPSPRLAAFNVHRHQPVQESTD